MTGVQTCALPIWTKPITARKLGDDFDRAAVLSVLEQNAARAAEKRGRYADDDETSEDDVMAERIIHLAPPITAIVCALIVALSLVYHFVLA